MNLTFEDLPKAVTMLTKEFSDLKRWLHENAGKHPIEKSEEFFTVQQAADFLNLAVPTIYSKVSKGELPSMKRGKRLYFSSTELMDYLKDGQKKSSTQIEAEVDAYFSRNKKGGRNAN